MDPKPSFLTVPFQVDVGRPPKTARSRQNPYQKSPQIFFWRLWAEKVNFCGPNLASQIVPKSSSGGPWGPSGAQGAAGALRVAILEAFGLHLGSIRV